LKRLSNPESAPTVLDYPLLAAVAAVVREGSFERAADSLHVTPSAVSQRVKLLEERLGQPLVRRGQPCRATAAGERLCRHAEQVMLMEHSLAAELPALQATPSGAAAWPSVPVAVNADSLATWFVEAAAASAQASPMLFDIKLEDQDHTAAQLERGEVLAAVTALASPVRGCRSHALGALRYRATASPAFVARHFAAGVDAQNLAAAPCLVFNRQDRLQERWMAAAVGHAPAVPRHWLPSTQAFVDAARLGLGWGMNPEPLVAAALADGRLAELPPQRWLDVPLHWQYLRAAERVLAPLTAAVLAAAARQLRAASETPEKPL
jgi:LysR family transcriptional regulator, chromosome initiation inhibitor